MMTPEEISRFIANEKEAKLLLEAHLGKPDKTKWFYKALKKTYKDGKIKGAAVFSWWAFLGEGFYLLYRKLYGFAISVFVILFVASFLFPNQMSAVGVAVAVTCGFSAPTVYFAKFFKDLEKAGYGQKPLSEVAERMAVLGGFNTWALYVAAVFLLAALIFFLSLFFEPLVPFAVQ